MQVEEIKISDIENHPKNPKQHPENQIRLIQKSIERFGYTNPFILSADGVILAGHARVKAAIAMGQDSVPCIRTKLTGDEADAYLLADNRLADISPYDRDILAELLSNLPKDLAEITGFDQVQVDALLSGEDIPDIDKFISDSQPEEPREEVDAEPQIDRAAELNEKWQVKPGDMWQCGEHRIICGDCTDPAVVERVMMGEKAEMVFTDPPYNIDYRDIQKKHSKIKNDDIPDFDFKKFLSSALKNIPKTSYICCNWMSYSIFSTVLEEMGLPTKSCIVWDKEIPAQHLDKYFKQHEFILFTGKLGGEKTIRGDVWRIKRGKSDVHPTMKPVELVMMAISDNPALGVVLDPFLGSGTTLIACENTGRKARGIEISPDYVAVCLQRFKDATGKEPVRING